MLVFATFSLLTSAMTADETVDAPRVGRGQCQQMLLEVLLESVMEVTASTDDRARSQRGGRAFKRRGDLKEGG